MVSIVAFAVSPANDTDAKWAANLVRTAAAHAIAQLDRWEATQAKPAALEEASSLPDIVIV